MAPASAFAPAIFSIRTVRVLNGHVVVDHHLRYGNAVRRQKIGRHLEVHDVARVVLHDKEDALTAVHGLGRLVHLIGSGRGEHFAGAGRVEHTVPHVPSVKRFVPAAAAGEDGNLFLGRVGPQDSLDRRVELHQTGMRRGETGERFDDDVIHFVEELFH